MRCLSYVLGLGLVLTTLLGRIHGQEARVSFDLVLERPGFPDFDVHPVVFGANGSEHLFTAGMVITSALAGRGVQGWSISLQHQGLEAVALSLEGTVSASKAEGGLRDQGFLKYEMVCEPTGSGDQGVVQAVVLSFLASATLPPSSSALVGINTYRARAGEEPYRPAVFYNDGLQGSGQPVTNAVTLDGATVVPFRSRRRLAVDVASRPAELDCANGQDDNGNGWTDCDDPDCDVQPACGAEDCGDGIDNDGDAIADCADFDCGRSAACRSPERCSDGIDNDRDLRVDCADTECFEIGECPGPEICGDVVDNDLDGRLDCLDSDCFGILPCIGRELCGDGIDNNGDGEIDCRDPQCVRSPGCLEREDCDDGFDNDADDYIDCDDFDCFDQPPCPGFEHCGDGVDNNGDGKVDCDDFQCRGAGFCRGRVEICDDRRDNEGDGLTDCDDPDCQGRPGCPLPENCGDGRDNDLDQLVDCDDPDCRPSLFCPAPEVCDDRVDNDEDQLIDCEDPECRRRPSCIQPEACDDGRDNDGDGSTDCADAECAGQDGCPAPEDCSDGRDNDLDLLVDCDDSDCRRAGSCVRPEDCSDGRDNDEDLRADCADFDCRRDAACPGLEICDDGADNDGNGLADCADSTCSESPACAQGGGGFDLVIVAERSRWVGDRHVVDIDPAVDPLVPITVFAVPFPRPQPGGIQGWSLAVAHDRDRMDFDPDGGAPTTSGTDAEAVFSGGFRKTEAVTGQGQGGGVGAGLDGFVSAVVLSFTEPATLDPGRAQSLARARYVVHDLVAARAVGNAAVQFKSGLRGSGQPINNAFTIGGATVDPTHLVPLEIRRGVTSAPFVRGDINQDGKVDLGDAIWCVNDLVRSGPASPCRLAGDANADGFFDLADPVFLIIWQFLGGPGVPPPYPRCGRAVGSPGLECPAGAARFCPEAAGG